MTPSSGIGAIFNAPGGEDFTSSDKCYLHEWFLSPIRGAPDLERYSKQVRLHLSAFYPTKGDGLALSD
jgi:hypothetical protein